MTDRSGVRKTAKRPPLWNLWRDPAFWLAVLAGPMVWLGLYMLNPPEIETHPPLFPGPKIFLLAGFYPLLEEVLFRGLLQPQLLKILKGRAVFLGLSLANLMTTALFVAFHFFNQPPLWALMLIFPSLVFGAFRDKYGSVVPAIFLHCFYNLGYFVVFPPG